MHQGKCKLCGVKFTAKSRKKKHCSDKCRDNDRYRSDTIFREAKKRQALRWFNANKEHVRQLQHDYYLSHYTEFAERNFKRRDRTLPAELVKNVMESDNYTCQYCHVRGGKLTIDHKQPVSRGGTDSPENLCVACHTCNCRKGRKTVAEYMEHLLQC